MQELRTIHEQQFYFVGFHNGPLLSHPSIGMLFSPEKFEELEEGQHYGHPTYSDYVLKKIDGKLIWVWEGAPPPELPPQIKAFLEGVEDSGMSHEEIKIEWQKTN